MKLSLFKSPGGKNTLTKDQLVAYSLIILGLILIVVGVAIW